VLAEDLVPLLEEYCYEDYGALARILGPGLVTKAASAFVKSFSGLPSGRSWCRRYWNRRQTS
jgi:hypothetical protein